MPGLACAAFHDEKVRNVAAKRVQCDEIWSFSYAKNKNVKFAKAAPEGAGDVWTWTAIDADSKLIISWHVGDRSTYTGTSFRLANRVQPTTDGHKAYLKAVAEVDFDADYAMLNKIFATDYAGAGRYSAQVHRRDQEPDHGQPGPGPYQHVLCRTPEPDHAHANAPVHPADQCVLQEVREPLPRAGAVLRVLQFLPRPQDAWRNPGDGSGTC